LGYANEVGESFRALVPKALVWATYGVATAYVTADAADKGRKAAELNKDSPERTKGVTVAVIDTFVWQALASVAIPGFTINRICAASLYIMGHVTRWPLPARKWATTAIGLSAIPVIITPIDRQVLIFDIFHLCWHVKYQVTSIHREDSKILSVFGGFFFCFVFF
ncbi:unnamed protein product, partial [Staurois parvus]